MQARASGVDLDLNAFLDGLKQPREMTLEAFQEGIKAFIFLANTSPEKRAAIFGDRLNGLHYGNQYADLTGTEAHQVYRTCPPEWEYASHDGKMVLLYRGDKPSLALNNLLKGPTIIDCAMFCQLSIWFGIRYLLGDEKFDALFNRGPFYVTQFLYQPISHVSHPYLGNPLFSFFEKESTLSAENDVCVRHVANEERYQLKHPGGTDSEQNCIEMRDDYFMFDPMAKHTSHLSRQDVVAYLIENFNQPPNRHDESKLLFYKKKYPEEIHPILGFNFETLIIFAGYFKDLTVDEATLEPALANSEQHHIRFNFEAFQHWVSKMTEVDNKKEESHDYLPVDALNLDSSIIETIPFENRDKTFENYKTQSALHRKIYDAALNFCSDVMQEKSAMVVLTGKAGIGKSSVAVCCAKELAARGKKIIWVSEVTIKGWTEQAKSINDVIKVRDRVQTLLANDPDAIILDDNNLAGYAGIVLAEEMLIWFLSHPGKGLFITSNEEMHLEKLYGWHSFSADLTKFEFCFPPLASYTSQSYMNQPVVLCDLKGQYMRGEICREITSLTETEKLDAIVNCRAEQSVGVMVSKAGYESIARQLGAVEYVPAFDDEEIALIIRHINGTNNPGAKGPVYEAMPLIKKRWLKTHFVLEIQRLGNHPPLPAHWSMAIKKFENTPSKVIVVELNSVTFSSGDIEINRLSTDQLLRIVNFAHDQGGKRVIIINNTHLDNHALYEKIIAQLPKEEQERTASRLKNLLLTSALLDVSSNSPSIKEMPDDSEILQQTPEQEPGEAEPLRSWPAHATALHTAGFFAATARPAFYEAPFLLKNARDINIASDEVYKITKQRMLMPYEHRGQLMLMNTAFNLSPSDDERPFEPTPLLYANQYG